MKQNKPRLVRIRTPELSDLGALSALCEEMEWHYRGPERVSADRIRASLVRFLLTPATKVSDALIAQHGTELAGLATFTRVFPAEDMGTALLLKELYVKKSARHLGIATKLLAAVAARALETGCCRVDWTADADNDAAQKFYDRISARRTGKIYYRLEGGPLHALAAQSAGDGS